MTRKSQEAMQAIEHQEATKVTLQAKNQEYFLEKTKSIILSYHELQW